MYTSSVKHQIQSLSSLSVQQRESQQLGSQIHRNSFELVNILKVRFTPTQDSDQFQRKDFRNSFQLLQSSLGCSRPNRPVIPVAQYGLHLSEDDKMRIERAGGQPMEIGDVVSESEREAEAEEEIQDNSSYGPEPQYQLAEYMPSQLVDLLHERNIPLHYVRGLFAAMPHQIKSVRRLKVQRYLEKRRHKTWNRKICYNCRQKVAEERLRIKGKFIKKRKAMEMLGLTSVVSVIELKRRLEIALADKTQAQIVQLIKG